MQDGKMLICALDNLAGAVKCFASYAHKGLIHPGNRYSQAGFPVCRRWHSVNQGNLTVENTPTSLQRRCGEGGPRAHRAAPDQRHFRQSEPELRT